MAEQSNLELLHTIYRNAETGRDGLYYVLRKTDDTAFRKLVETQMMEYQNILDEAEDRLRRAGEEPDGTSTMAKLMVRMSASRKTAQDNSPSALADMLIQGSTLGVTNIVKQIRTYSTQCDDCLELAGRLQETEENNIHRLKQYL